VERPRTGFLRCGAPGWARAPGRAGVLRWSVRAWTARPGRSFGTGGGHCLGGLPAPPLRPVRAFPTRLAPL